MELIGNGNQKANFSINLLRNLEKLIEISQTHNAIEYFVRD